MGVGNSGSRIGAVAVALLAAVALCAALVASAGGAPIVAKNGRVYACYKTKGKAKGAVRLVPKNAHCKKGTKKVSWSVSGPAGEAGQGGENGSGGESGSGGETGATGAKGLEAKVSALTSKVASLESVLKGISNTDLVGMLSKLNGISATQLQETVAAVIKVNALCEQAKTLTGQSNALGQALGGLQLLGGLPPLELKSVVPIPTPLSAFACP